MVSTTRSTGSAGTATGPEAVTITEPARSPGQGGQKPRLLHRGHGIVEAGDVEEHGRLFLVGEEDVDLAMDEFEEFPTVTAHAESVREGEGDQGIGAWATSMARRRAFLAGGCSQR